MNKVCRRAGVIMKNHLVTHRQAGLGIIAARLFAQGIMGGWYYCSLVYEYLSG